MMYSASINRTASSPEWDMIRVTVDDRDYYMKQYCAYDVEYVNKYYDSYKMINVKERKPQKPVANPNAFMIMRDF